MEIIIKEKMSEEEAMPVASRLSKAGTLLKWYLGRLWNSVDSDTKLTLIEKFGYAPATMRGLGAIVKKYPVDFENEFKDNPAVTFSHFDYAARSDDPVATIKEAVDKKMTCTEVLELTKKDTEKVKAQISLEELQELEQLPYDEPNSVHEYQKNSREVARQTAKVEKVTPSDVFDFFGIFPGKVTKETYSILYRNASKSCHPDTGGDDENFLRFSQVADNFSKYVVN